MDDAIVLESGEGPCRIEPDNNGTHIQARFADFQKIFLVSIEISTKVRFVCNMENGL